MDVVINLRKNDENKHARHYIDPQQENRTLCGLSLKSGHAWGKPNNPDSRVSCGKCLDLAFKKGFE